MRFVLAAWMAGVAALAADVSASPASFTFHKDVLPILQKHCQTCHRPGQIGPFHSSIIRALVPGRRPSRTRSAPEKCRLGWPIPSTGILTTIAP